MSGANRYDVITNATIGNANNPHTTKPSHIRRGTSFSIAKKDII
jgi:hypothetical protein